MKLMKKLKKKPYKKYLNPKSKAKATSKAKPKIKITKEPASVSEAPQAIQNIEEEPIIEEQPKTDQLKQIVKCPDCNMGMTQHTLEHIHKKNEVVVRRKNQNQKKTPVP